MKSSQNGKIPYDNDTIYRQQSRKSVGRGTNGITFSGSSKLLALLVCVLLIFNIILGIVVFSGSGKNNKPVVSNSVYNIYGGDIDVSAVVSKALPSTVLVHAGLKKSLTTVTYDDFFNNMVEKGSGVILKDEKEQGIAYILTCYHVIRPDVNEIYVVLNSSYKPIKATRVYSSVAYDIAVIKIEDEEYKNENIIAHPCEIADSCSVSFGDNVVAIGNPMGKGFSVTDGVVSVPSELISVSNSSYLQRVIRISSPINAGNSGGGLFNAKGQYLGMVAVKSGDTSSASIDCIAYAIPGTFACNMAFNIIDNSAILKPVVGAEFENSGGMQEARIIGDKTILVDKVVVSSVKEGTPAYAAGIKENDRLLRFSYDGKTVEVVNKYTFEDHVFAMRVGTKVTFIIERDGSVIEKIFTIEKTERINI